MVAYTFYPWDPRVRREAETLARMGYSVTIVCAREGDQPEKETVGGVQVSRVALPIRRGGPLCYAYQYLAFLLLAALVLRRIRRIAGLGAVHVHSLPDFMSFVGIGARLRGTPLVLDLHEAMPELVAARFPRSRLLHALALATERVSCLLADRVVVVNETVRELLAGRGVPMDRLTVVYNSPDPGTFSVGDATPRPSPGHIRLVYAGGVNLERDLETLIRAVAHLRNIATAELAIYGPGSKEYLAYLRGLVDGLGLRDVVTFGGVIPSDRVLAYEAAADVGVATYVRNPHTEVALPTKGFEFVFLGKPLVLPDLKAMKRMFDGAALFYEVGNSGDLAAKIREAAAGGPSIDAMKTRARALAEATRWEEQVRRLAAAYGTLATTGEAPGGG